jgi:hypothetical protein
MKKFNLLMCATLMVSLLFAQTVSTFENLPLATDTFWNGSDLSGGFNNGLANFANDYDTIYFSWSGFVYSNVKDSITAGYGNQYAAITANGYNGSEKYAVADDYGNAKIRLTGNASGKLVKGFYVTNTTYAYQSMKQGDAFAKKFGGSTGNDPDWFRLRAMGWLNGAMKQQAVDFFLADFRSADSTQDYLVRDWRWFDLLPLGDVDSIIFQLTSSDTSFGYMNTPAYFAMDDFTTGDTIYVLPSANDDAVNTNYLNDTLIAVLANDAGLVANPKVELLSAPLIPGATATVENNEIHYTPAIGLVAADSIMYRVYDALGASDTAVVYINVTGVTGLDEITDVAVKVYPNPFSNNVSIRSTAVINQIDLLDVAGALIKTISNIESNTIELDTEELSSGIYFLRMNSVNGNLVKKIVKR